MGITAKELAERLHLSATAVSMALNQKPGVSKQTRDMVIKEAEKCGYDFSKLSRGKTKSGCIYCVIYRANNALLNYAPIFSELTDGIEQECRLQNYQLRIMQFYDKTDDLTDFIDKIKISDCSGIILLGTEVTEEVCYNFISLHIPFLLLDAYYDSLNCSSVLINNTQGAHLATSYLIQRCHCQPGYLQSSYRIGNFEERKNGFYKAVRENGMSTSKSIIHELAPSIEGAMADMLEIIDRGDDIARGYFADNDLIAIGAIRAFKLRGYKLPEDISIIGFDNISEGKVLEPSLTTINIPRNFMGQTAARQIIYQIDNPVPHTVKIEVSTNLVKRFSV